MPLNLGNLTNEYSSMSTEELLLEAADAEIELTEILHSVENLENARKIQDLAKQSGSVECMNFAEELLGCSVEVQLPSPSNGGVNQFKKLLKNAIPELKRQINLFERNVSSFGFTENTEDKDAVAKERVMKGINSPAFKHVAIRIASGIKKYHELMPNGMAILSKLKDVNEFAITKRHQEREAKKAIAIFREFANYLEQVLNHLPNDLSEAYQVKYLGVMRWGISCIRTAIAVMKSLNRVISQTYEK